MRHGMLIRYVIAAVFVMAGRGLQAETRTWKSSDGKYSVEAELLEVTKDAVRLKKADGTLVTVPFDRLSDADRKFVQDLPAPDDPKAALKQQGVTPVGSELLLTEETEFAAQMRDLPTARKRLADAAKILARDEALQREADLTTTRLTQINLQLNSQLATVTDAATNNRLVGAINANVAQMELLQQQEKALNGQIKASRTAANQAREAFVQQLLELRTKADAVAARYEGLAADAEFTQHLEAFNRSLGKTYALKPSRRYRLLTRQLEEMEETVLSDAIPLRRDGGGGLLVSVVIGDEHTQEMVLDSGASLITLSQDIAEKCGIMVKSTDPTIRLSLANGSVILGKQVTIPKVRVGKFSAENVECAVLDVESGRAPSLLGMSFLENFKFEINAQEGTLKMLQVSLDSAPKADGKSEEAR
jgi:clan AA aspartic protease (TIGR02281 family)